MFHQQGQAITTAVQYFLKQVQQRSEKRVRFDIKPRTQQFRDHKEVVVVTYDSGTDGNYMSESDRKHLGLPMLRESKRRV